MEKSLRYKPLLQTPDQEDIALTQSNARPELLTERLRELVPLLQFVGARVQIASPEQTVITIPLLESAMNQNGTQQAAVFYLLADYTLGIAMWASLPGTYTVGVHDRCHACPLQLWLKSGKVEHIAPGNGEIRGEASIEPGTALRMREQLFKKGRTQLKAEVKIYQGDTLVAIAEHEVGVYVDLPRVSDKAVSATQLQRIKTSALMIAAFRDDEVSKALAGEQGLAIAQRMAKASPQLPALIAARSQHAHDVLRRYGESVTQVVVLGAGIDAKPLRYASDAQAWYLCDLREMLRDRARRLKKADRRDEYSTSIPVDFRLQGWHKKILASSFDPHKKTIVFLEGVSMYLTPDELRQTAVETENLLAHPASLLWMDHVSTDLLKMQQEPVSSFLSAMSRLGEPFITGFTDAAEFLGRANWSGIENMTAAQVLAKTDDPVCEHYRFSLLSKRAAQA